MRSEPLNAWGARCRVELEWALVPSQTRLRRRTRQPSGRRGARHQRGRWRPRCCRCSAPRATRRSRGWSATEACSRGVAELAAHPRKLRHARSGRRRGVARRRTKRAESGRGRTHPRARCLGRAAATCTAMPAASAGAGGRASDLRAHLRSGRRSRVDDESALHRPARPSSHRAVRERLHPLRQRHLGLVGVAQSRGHHRRDLGRKHPPGDERVTLSALPGCPFGVSRLSHRDGAAPFPLDRAGRLDRLRAHEHEGDPSTPRRPRIRS